MTLSSISALRAATPRAFALAIAAAALAPAGALAAGAPIAAIGDPPDHNSDNSYTLHDIVNPNGAVTTVTFEYGTTSSFGNTASAGSVPAAAGDTSVSGTTNPLTVGSGLYFRLKAVNSYGTTYSGTQSLVVTGAPLITPGASPVRNRDGSFTLRSLVDPQGLQTGVNIEYGPTTSYGTLISSSLINPGPAQQAFIITSPNLVSGTAVHYAAIATNDDGTTTQADQSFTVPSGAPYVNPGTAPVHNGTGTETIHALVNPDGYTTSSTFEYGTTTSYGTTQSTISISPGAPQQVPGIVPAFPAGTTVHYRFNSTNSVGVTHGSDQTYVAS